MSKANKKQTGKAAKPDATLLALAAVVVIGLIIVFALHG
jgi:hypothetical protein